ncbi:STAS domain-containing protein [Amycolatopsis endophytica]|uniref:Anti-sigma factor antagonist n=1 Tax=Amycolatopsis endophytica TaxID=860233 RepID=A0A853BD78_9PSEU|nr:STAS domain-containing protein [Amycolatopsis endophytica]NYI93323.1 anti-anti-sigma factor [Amycolatopsis endophytica]
MSSFEPRDPVAHVDEAVEDLPGATLVRVSGELDHLTAPAFEAVALPAARQCRTRLVIDLSEVGFLTSAGIAVVLAAGTEAPGRVHVVAGTGFTRRSLEITGAQDVVRLWDTRDEALAAD